MSAAGDGSSDAGESGESGGIIAKEVNALSAESAYSPYAVPLILLFFGALFCYSFLASKEDEEDEAWEEDDDIDDPDDTEEYGLTVLNPNVHWETKEEYEARTGK